VKAVANRSRSSTAIAPFFEDAVRQLPFLDQPCLASLGSARCFAIRVPTNISDPVEQGFVTYTVEPPLGGLPVLRQCCGSPRKSGACTQVVLVTGQLLRSARF
jgi:hypothetical protein